jgi:hypothetical protein
MDIMRESCRTKQFEWPGLLKPVIIDRMVDGNRTRRVVEAFHNYEVVDDGTVVKVVSAPVADCFDWETELDELDIDIIALGD